MQNNIKNNIRNASLLICLLLYIFFLQNNFYKKIKNEMKKIVLNT
jgi:hypothetical protein